VGPCFYARSFCSFFVVINTPYHFTPLNLRPLFGLTFFGSFISIYVRLLLVGISLLIYAHFFNVGRYSSVGIATRYGLDGPGIESRSEARFSASVQTGSGTHTASYTMGTGSFQGVKPPGRGVDNPPTCSAEVKERVEVYLYSPLDLHGLF
jgi:hypothetical protein